MKRTNQQTLFVLTLVMALMWGQVALAKQLESPLFVKAQKEQSSIHNVYKQVSAQEIAIAMAVAKEKTAALEKQFSGYLEVSAMGFWQRWIKSINIYEVREDYGRHIHAHVKAMTEVLRLRRLNGNTFSSLSEFQFKILVRQSEYVLSVATTRDAMSKLSSRSPIAQRLEQATYQYNQERLVFDSKMLAWND